VSNTTRTTSSYDERYVVPLEASRRGAHRARVNPVIAALPVVAVVVAVLGAVGLVSVFLGGGGSSGGDAAGPAATSAAPSASAKPSPSASAEASPTSSSAEAPAGTVDKTIQVAVYNGAGTSGLGRRAADRLTGAGFKVGTIATWTGGAVAETTLYIGTEDQRATANAIVKALKHGTVKVSATKAAAGITVVVGSDYVGTPAAGGASATAPGTTKPRGGAATPKAPASSSLANAGGGQGGGTTPTPADPTASPTG